MQKRCSILEPYNLDKSNVGGHITLDITMKNIFKQFYNPSNDNKLINIENGLVVNNTEYFRKSLDDVLAKKKPKIPLCFNYKGDIDLLYYLWLNKIPDENHNTKEYELCNHIYFYNNTYNENVYTHLQRELVVEKLRVIFEYEDEIFNGSNTVIDSVSDIVRFELYHLNFE